jgi:hypothetical protein
MTLIEPVDQDALARAIETLRASKTPAVRAQIEDKLASEPWIEAAEFASYCCQCDALHLKPWQSPPCWIDDLESTLAAGDDGVLGDYAGAMLLRRMLDWGLSRYEPDPVAALKRAQRPPEQGR